MSKSMDATAELGRSDLARERLAAPQAAAAKTLRKLRRQALDLVDAAQDKAKDLAEAAQDRARDLAGTAQDRARDLAGVAQERAKDLGGVARKKAARQLEQQRSAAAEALEAFAEALRPKAERLARQADAAAEEGRSGLAKAVASRLPVRGTSPLVLVGAVGLGVAVGFVISNRLRARRDAKAGADAPAKVAQGSGAQASGAQASGAQASGAPPFGSTDESYLPQGANLEAAGDGARAPLEALPIEEAQSKGA